MRYVTLILLALLILSCGGRADVDTVADFVPVPEAVAIPDTEIGLSPTGVHDVTEPPETIPNTSAPGEIAPPPRPWNGAPPVIPHAVEDFLPITRTENLCLDCHQVDQKLEGEATPIPSSHYTDLRHAPDTVGETVVGARHNCTACHAPQTGAPPLLVNTFRD